MARNPIPPYSNPDEENVIGACLSSKSFLNQVVDVLKAEDFYNPSYGEIYAKVIELYTGNVPVDHLTVLNALRASKSFTQQKATMYLMNCMEAFSTPSGALEAARTVAGYATLRRMIQVGNQVQALGFSIPEDVQAAVAEAEQMIYDLARGRLTSRLYNVAESLDAFLTQLEQGDSPAISTGFRNLDEILTGFRPGQLIVVAARPGMGKSVLLSDFSIRIARAGKVAAMFSFEMSKDELLNRQLSSVGRIPLRKLMVPKNLEPMDWNRITSGAAKLAEFGERIYIDDSSDKGITEIQATCRRIAAKGDLGLVVIDYLQLVTPPKAQSREQEVAQMSRAFKLLAKELGIPVVIAAQLNRNVELRTDKRPGLADLRESGAIEQDADVVLCLYRPEVYDADDEPGTAEVLVRKQRNGPTGTAFLTFLRDYTTFEDQAKPWVESDGSDSDDSRQTKKVEQKLKERRRVEADDMLGPDQPALGKGED